MFFLLLYSYKFLVLKNDINNSLGIPCLSRGTQLEQDHLPTPPEVSWLPCFSWLSCHWPSCPWKSWPFQTFHGLWEIQAETPPEVGSPCNCVDWGKARARARQGMGHSTSYQSEPWSAGLCQGRFPASQHSQQFPTRTSWQADCLSGWDPRSSSRRCSGTRGARPWPTPPPGENLGLLRSQGRPRLSSGCSSHLLHHWNEDSMQFYFL